MYHGIDAVGRESLIHKHGQLVDAEAQKIRQILPDEVECQIKNQEHHAEKHRQRGIFPRENFIHLHGAAMLLALVTLHHADVHHVLNEAIAHVRQSGIAVESAFLLHLHDAVLQQLLFVLIQLQLPQHALVALDELGGGKTSRNARFVGVILDHMHHGMDAAVHRRITGAEVIYLGQGLAAGGVHRLIQQFRYALALHGADGHHRNTQASAQLLHVDGAAVGTHLVHHIQRQHHRHPQLQKLQRQVEISLDVGSVHNIDDAVGLFLEDEVAGDDLLLRIGTQGVYARQIHHGAAFAVLYLPHLLIHRHAGEIAHMLV